MLDYLKTVEGLTVIRDEIRLRLDDETRDRQSIAEFAEASLTQILGELVTPDPMCLSCEDNGQSTPAVGMVTTTGEGVCEAHIWPTLLAGHAINVRTDMPLGQALLNQGRQRADARSYPPAHCGDCGVHLMPVEDPTGAVSYLDSQDKVSCVSGRLHRPVR